MVSKNSESSTQANQLSDQGLDQVREGKRAMEEMTSNIEEIRKSHDEVMSQVTESNHQISNIVKVISEIEIKTKVINEIVFQTKLLSFNASVEAARAGEHGKGFAVVAEEVGNLASMSGKAAEEIRNLLETSVSQVNDIAQSTKQKVETMIHIGKEKVERGVKAAKQCESVLDEIIGNVNSVNRMVSDISIASHEQATGVGEINKAMSHLDQATQQNATSSQDAASASAHLSVEAENLQTVVMDLTNIIFGKSSASTEPIRSLD